MTAALELALRIATGFLIARLCPQYSHVHTFMRRDPCDEHYIIQSLRRL